MTACGKIKDWQKLSAIESPKRESGWIMGAKKCQTIENTSDDRGKIHVEQAFLCALFLSKKEDVHLFSSSFPCLEKCHEMSRIFPD